MRGRKHSDETQSQVMAALLAGQGVMEVSRQYDLPESTIREWVDSEQIAQVRAKKGEQIEALLFDYLTTNLQALKSQAQIASEREYIIEQPAGELAVLHGVMADKSVRLLEAIERARASSQSSSNSDNGSGTKELPA